MPLQRGRTQWKSNDEVLKSLELLLEGTPQSLGYLRSRWSSELLAKVLGERTGVTVHASTVRRWLALSRFGYRRARPTLHIRDPRKAERMQAIKAALASQGGGTEVFYVDELGYLADVSDPSGANAKIHVHATPRLFVGYPLKVNRKSSAAPVGSTHVGLIRVSG